MKITSEYITMYTHGFIYGFLNNINRNALAKICIKNYKNHKNRRTEAMDKFFYEDIFIPFDKHIKEIASQMSMSYENHFGKTLSTIPGPGTHWAQVHYKNESTQYHDHLNKGVDVVGAYYVKMPPNGGDLMLRYKKHELDRSEWIFPPEENKFIIFDSGLVHGVSRNRSNNPRICISINFKINEKK